MTAKILVVITIAAGYYVALVPMMLVYAHHVGVPLLLQKLLIWAPCLLVVSIAIGALIGVLFIGESIAAPATGAVKTLSTNRFARGLATNTAVSGTKASGTRKYAMMPYPSS